MTLTTDFVFHLLLPVPHCYFSHDFPLFLLSNSFFFLLLLSSSLSSRMDRSDTRSWLRGLHKSDPAGRVRRPVDPAVPERSAALRVPPHDELQRAEPRLRLRQIWRHG